MKYLVTGAQGFVGRYAVARLLRDDADAEILGVGRSPEANGRFTHKVHWNSIGVVAPLPKALRCLPDPRYRYAVADLQDRAALEDVVRAFRPDIVLHAASGLRDDPVQHLFRTNVEGTYNLLEALCSAGHTVRQVVLCSSGAVYGNAANKHLPLGEDLACEPGDYYSVSKLASERVSRILTEQRGLPAVWARIFNIVGPGQEERHFCGRAASQIAPMQALAKPRRIEAGDLTPTRDFIDVRDVAVALIVLANRGLPGQTYNVASGTETSMRAALDLGLAAAAIADPVEVRQSYSRSADVPRAYADVCALRSLGFAPAFDLRKSMEDLIAYYGTDVRDAAQRL